ncbi:MAG: hypothetical protein G01um101438_638 [Parcubacteria group bacterium Gr01-1014_38]|nr:MAG: hypothetical protein G01um101438_638 [Parcubacteria group bacterium Gr01-1014_38]
MTLPKFIGITELRNNVRKVFDRLSKDGAPIVVIRESKPEAVIVSYRDFESLMNGENKELLNVKAEPLSIP